MPYMDTQSLSEPPMASSSKPLTSISRMGRKEPRRNGIMTRTTEITAVPTTDARLLDERVAQRRGQLIAQKKKELLELLERHDDAVREAFHLDRFVTLASFDPEVAKTDTSQVFNAFRARFDLVASNIENVSGSGATAARRTRRAINDKRETIEALAQNLALVSSPSAQKASKGKGKAAQNASSAPSEPSRAKPKIAFPSSASQRFSPRKGRKSLPSRLDGPVSPAAPTPRSSGRGRGRGRGRGGRGKGVLRTKSLSAIVREPTSSDVDELESEDEVPPPTIAVAPAPQPTIPRLKKLRKRNEVESVNPPSTTIKRIKLIHRVPPPTYTHHEQLPPDKAYGGDLTKFLQSFVRLEDDGPDMVIEELNAAARIDGAYLRRINQLRGHGRLSHVEGSLPQEPEPPRPLGHWDSVVEGASIHLRIVRENGRARVNGARRVARLINAHWEKVAGADEKSKRLEEKKMQALVRSTLRAVQAHWKDAVKYVKQMKLAQEKEEQARRGRSIWTRSLSILRKH
ncbi:uncharacterized protein EI90DRAFT_1010738 [Cantharellus anzutake]|uniref:uncharacterized protein n=1 Tax=Cantharellus anzutake TaxID=1750568 RepID=UPI0019030870|nr:uncharacterized protein EI90DRAFT_1010738 [Cantharellus anzutake]KAF8331341.1 hypothetical protein EI90DRAFT_1010738 [Cantharellus anzutake]